MSVRLGVAAVLAAVVVRAAPVAHAQPQARLEEYVVAQGDSCRSIARTRFGDPRRIDLIHAHNALGPTPHRLAPGTTLRLPTRALVDSVAGVTRVVRDVDVQRAEAPDWASARIGQPLQRGDRIATGERSASELVFREGGSLQMRAQSLVVLTGSTRRSVRAERVVRATLERGALRGRLAELTGRATVTTPSATARLGQEAVIAVDSEGTSRVSSIEGTSVVDGVRVPEGSGTEVRRGARPSRPHPLPRPPRWRTGDPGRFAGLAHSGAVLRGGWQPVDGASRYRVEVAREPDGTDLIAALEVSGDATEFSIPRIPTGTYYVSVSTIDRAFFEGPPSPRRAMVVLEARIVPPGGGEPPSDRLDPGDPSRPYAPPRALPGTWLVAPRGLRCGVGDALEELSTFRALGRHTVRCVDTRDRPVAGFDVIVVEARIRARRPVLRRGAQRRVNLLIESPLVLPDRLIARAPPGISVGSVVLEGYRDDIAVYRATVGAAVDTPDSVIVVFEVAAGSERIRVGEASFALRDRRPRRSRARR